MLGLSSVRLGSILDREGKAVTGAANNFNLLRLASAALVLYGHSYSIQASKTTDPIGLFLVNEYCGSVGVYVFFLISGMLISKSAENHKSTLVFLIHRILRVWPGLMVMMAVVFLLIIPLTSRISPFDVLANRFVGLCYKQNVILIYGACVSTPVGFDYNHLKNAFNYSLWTLPVEIYCYGVVLIGGMILRFRISGTERQKIRYAIYIALVTLAFFYMTLHKPTDWRFVNPFTVMGGYSSFPVLFFLLGMFLYTIRDFIAINQNVALALLIAYICVHNNSVMLYIALVYGVLALAANEHLRGWNPRHDYSYGMYIYAFPVQQSVAHYFPDADGYSAALLSLPVTLIFAALSWHFVERPCIRWGKSLLSHPWLNFGYQVEAVRNSVLRKVQFILSRTGR